MLILVALLLWCMTQGLQSAVTVLSFPISTCPLAALTAEPLGAPWAQRPCPASLPPLLAVWSFSRMVAHPRPPLLFWLPSIFCGCGAQRLLELCYQKGLVAPWVCLQSLRPLHICLWLFWLKYAGQHRHLMELLKRSGNEITSQKISFFFPHLFCRPPKPCPTQNRALLEPHPLLSVRWPLIATCQCLSVATCHSCTHRSSWCGILAEV